MCFFGSLLRSAVETSSRVTTVSVPLFSTDFTVITIVPGWLGDSFAKSSRGGMPDCTNPYVHLLPSTSGRIFCAQIDWLLAVGPRGRARRCASLTPGTEGT